MLDLEELKQFVAFADKGTLSKVAEEFHISTPSITRSMRNIEECFGVSLFNRSKNRIELNDTGREAVEYARKLLDEEEKMLAYIKRYDEQKKTIVIKSCAPAPLWELLKEFETRYAGKTIVSKICRNEEVIQYMEQNDCDAAILPYDDIVPEGWSISKFMEEHLYVCVPREHKLAEYTNVRFSELNGFNFLLKSELGFWDTLCHRMMPSSKFLVQTDEAVFDEIVNASSLPCFTTDYFTNYESMYPDRINIPITDDEANVTFYVLYRKKDTDMN